VKSLQTIIEEHESAMAQLEKEKVEIDRGKTAETGKKAQEHAKAQEAWQAQLKEGQDRAEAFKAKIPELYDEIEAWVKDVPSTSFERKNDRLSATLTIGKVQIAFDPNPEKVHAGINISSVPWNKILSDPATFGLKDGAWYISKFNEDPVALNEASFNEQIESWLKSVQRGIVQ
jgi:hypothetical protein